MPFCANCGRDLSPAAVSCPSCGHPGPAAGALAVASPARRTEGFAVASLVCAISGLFLIPVVGGILGIVFGTTARRRIAQDPTLGGVEMARAGIIVGWIGVVVTLLAVLFLIVIAIGFRNWTF